MFLHDGTVIGDVALQGLDWRNRSCSLGLGVHKTENRGKGYGKEAARLMLAYAFDNLGLERVEASTLARNVPAQRSLQSIGFQLEGMQREAVYYAGKRHDRMMYGLLVGEWRMGSEKP